ncbi:MAG: hypothetical protein JW973_06590 [Bacteroidales bacterium]|nr:hypothetical protein [Bacteroidales bacterium]
MKTCKSFCKNYRAIMCCLILFSLSACNESYLDETASTGSVNLGFAKPNDVLSHLDSGSDILIVENGSSVQEAINVAREGDVIFIEPGIYKEAITINKPRLKLIGACSTSDEPVILENPGNARKAISVSKDEFQVEILNIQFKNFREENTRVSRFKCSGTGSQKLIRNMQREELGNGIAHYTYDLQLGSGEFDAVCIHRVVREHCPWHPVLTTGEVFNVPGGINTFEAIFLTAGAEMINEETSTAYFLASKNIDVWGIDLGWTKVPMETSDFSFMKDWGIERDVTHTLKALAIVRLMRGFSMQGFQRVNLLGYCYGAQVAYGAAGRETQLHPFWRQVKAIIPVDHLMKYEPIPELEEFRQNQCSWAAVYKAKIESGNYMIDDGAGFIYMATLAFSAPGEDSPVIPGLTNYQALLAVGSNPPDDPDTPFWHFFGGDMNDFLYSDPDRFIRFGMTLPPYMPAKTFYDLYACGCNEENVSFDDHIAQISLPILYIGAGGGMGTVGYYTGNLTSSNDITNFTVTIPGVEPLYDFGHADLWIGYNANELVWEVLYKWLLVH